MEFQVGDVVTIDDRRFVGRIVKFLTETKRMVQYVDFEIERFLIRELDISYLEHSNDEDKTKLKKFAIEHNKRLKIERNKKAFA